MAVGKKELADALGWHRFKLDRRLKSDPNFPIHSVVDGKMQFELADVHAYLDGSPGPAPIDLAQLADAVKPPAAVPDPLMPGKPGKRSFDHRGEATARQRKENAQAQMIELKLAIEYGKVIDAAEAKHVMTTAMVQLASDLESLPETLAKRLDLGDAAIPEIRKHIDNFREQLHRNLLPLLTADKDATANTSP